MMRNTGGFDVSGNVQESGEFLRGLQVTIRLLNSSYQDVSGYLNILGPATKTISTSGTFFYTINYIEIGCPQGEYYLRIDFNGSIAESGITLTDYMIHSSSTGYNLNITANSTISIDYQMHHLLCK